MLWTIFDSFWQFSDRVDNFWPILTFFKTVFDHFKLFLTVFDQFWTFLAVFDQFWTFYWKYTLMDDGSWMMGESTESTESIHWWMFDDEWWKKVQKVQKVQKYKEYRKLKKYRKYRKYTLMQDNLKYLKYRMRHIDETFWQDLFKASAFWTDAFYKSLCQYLCVCSVFEVPFQRLFPPFSWSRMYFFFRDLEFLGKSNRKK